MDFSIAIGIDEYIHLSETPYAQNDAIEFERIMKEIFAASSTKLLLERISKIVLG